MILFDEKINKYFHWIRIRTFLTFNTCMVSSIPKPGCFMHAHKLSNSQHTRTRSFSSIPFYLWIYFNVISLCIHFVDDLTTTHSPSLALPRTFMQSYSSFDWFWLMLFLFIAFKIDTKNKIPKWYVMYARSGNNESEHAREREREREKKTMNKSIDYNEHTICWNRDE